MPRTVRLNEREIEEALGELRGWSRRERTHYDGNVHVELHRLFEFSSFAEAMHFMLTASRFIHLTDHHPSWLNTYTNLEVWLTTGELKHQLSAKDVRLAKYLEQLFGDYAGESSNA